MKISSVLYTVYWSGLSIILFYLKRCQSSVIPVTDTLITTTANDNVTSAPEEITKPPFKHTCNCKIVQDNGKIIHDFGDIEEQDNVIASNPLATLSNSLIPEVFACHRAHQKCRTKCSAMLNLQQFNKNHHRNGMSYCLAYGSVTTLDGVDLHAEWQSSGTCKRSLPQRTYHSVKLCCGITFLDILPNSNHQAISVFAWDIDCKGLNFVFGP